VGRSNSTVLDGVFDNKDQNLNDADESSDRADGIRLCDDDDDDNENSDDTRRNCSGFTQEC
jgi:hypothetical protein